MGRLRMREVYITHDGPRLFACKNRMGTTYFGLFVDETDTEEIFLFAPVTEERFAAVRSGNLALRSAFESPHDGFLFVASFGTREPTETVSSMNAIELDDEWLPDDDAFLSYPTATAPALVVDEVSAEAVSEVRTLAAFELDAPFPTTEFPLRGLGGIMTLVQENVDSLGQELRDKVTARGAVQKEILAATEMNFRTVKAASFAFLISPTPAGKVLENELASESLRLLMDMLAAGRDDETLRATLEPLHSRALTKYRDLLEALEDSDTGVSMVLAGPDGNTQVSGLDLDGVARSLRMVRSSLDDDQRRRFVLEAELVGINVRTYTFELFDDTEEKKYSGRVAKEARPKLVGLTTGNRYEATLLEEAEILPLTGEIRYKYRLEAIWEPGRGEGAVQDVAPLDPDDTPPAPIGGMFA